MLTEQMDRLGRSGLTVTWATSSVEIRVGFSGACDRETLPHLALFLSDLHEEAERSRSSQVVIDCENLYFMSSASIKCVIGWIAKVKQASPEQRYVVEFRTNKRLAWQDRSLSAIARFAPQVVRVA